MVQEIRIDGAGMMKRILPGCRGMAHVLHLRQCHITVSLEDPEVMFGEKQPEEAEA
jgi:ribosomal protein L22